MWFHWDAIPRLWPSSLSHDIVFSWSHSYTGKGHFWGTQSQEGAEKNIMIAISFALAAFLRNMCDLKDKVVTEGKAGIFNDLPRAHSQSKTTPISLY